jgi:hypothetical protein
MKARHLEECIMLDTVGFSVDGINAKLTKTIDVDGEPGWSTAQMSSPSGKRSFRVKNVKKHKRLCVEGSAAAYFQGHNIVASNDLRMTVVSMLVAVKDKLKVHFPLWDAYNLVRGQDIAITRVDTPAMLRVPTGLTPAAVVNGLALAGLRCGINMALYQNESFYFDQNSQTVALKGYLKDVEMAQRRKKAVLPDTENAAALLELARSTVRIEPVFRQKYFKAQAQFKDTPPTPADLSPRLLAGMFEELLDKYDLRGRLRAFLTEENLYAIPPSHRAVVRLWQHGHDMLKHFNGDRLALGRQRRMLKKNYSIDIYETPPGEIEVPMQIGELLRAENFVPVPDAIRRDPQLLHTFDVNEEWRSICDRLNLTGGISRAFIDPYEDPDLPDTPQMPDFTAE